MNIQNRRPQATISVFGISFFHRQNPGMVAWWSIMFPGFGHYMLNQYIRGALFTLSEVIIDTLTHVNEGIIYSLCGQFEKAKAVTQTRWLFGYLAIFFFTFWDSIRSTVVQNKMCQLAEFEDEPLKSNIIYPCEIQYLEIKSPYTAAVYSFFFPGLGQVYNHRFGLGFYAMIWWWIYVTLSHAYESAFYFFVGNIQHSISVLNPHWFLFMPSVIGGSTYHAFITAIEHNRLYKVEQRQHFINRYQNSKVCIFD
ncbi:MAG: hypothetical protein H7Y18_20350 [Clostridiaceae bacterium]|nr:hypothetical protein [Clostridiaceae bacterium]